MRKLSSVIFGVIFSVSLFAHSVATVHLPTSAFFSGPASPDGLGADFANVAWTRGATIDDPGSSGDDVYVKVASISIYPETDAGSCSGTERTLNLENNSYWDSGRTLSGSLGNTNLAALHIHYSAIKAAADALGDTLSSGTSGSCVKVHLQIKNGDNNGSVGEYDVGNSQADLQLDNFTLSSGTPTDSTVTNAPVLVPTAHITFLQNEVKPINRMDGFRDGANSVTVKNTGLGAFDAFAVYANNSQDPTGISTDCPSETPALFASGAACTVTYDTLAASNPQNSTRGVISLFTTSNDVVSSIRLLPIDLKNAAVAQVAGGDNFACALLPTGGVKCWGNNAVGQLGDNSTTPTTAEDQPVNVYGLSQGVTQIAVGNNFACALMRSGGVKCWGSNASDQLGRSTTTDNIIPGYVSGLAHGVVQISAGTDHACALLATGGVKCWGLNSSAQLGRPEGAGTLAPENTNTLTGALQASAGGHRYTCAIKSRSEDNNANNAAVCWGSASSGRLGNGSASGIAPSPIAVHISSTISDQLTGISSLSTGYDTSCAVLENGQVKCWGNNSKGQVGNGSTTSLQTTPDFVRLNSSNGPKLDNVMQVSVGYRHTCALLSSGEVMCWGDNQYGQLGDAKDSGGESSVPVTVRVNNTDATPLTGVVMVSAGNNFSCALLSGGTEKCWGSGSGGELGTGNDDDSNIPVFVRSSGEESDPLADIVAISQNKGSHSCAVLSDGSAKCWGLGGEGRLGDGGTGGSNIPKPVLAGEQGGTNLSNVVSIAAGGRHTCGLLSDGEEMCWGENETYQLGDNSKTDALTPVYVDSAVDASSHLAGVIALTVGGSLSTDEAQSCALMSDNGLKCWGDNDSGQVGDGTQTTREAPVNVSDILSLNQQHNYCPIPHSSK